MAAPASKVQISVTVSGTNLLGQAIFVAPTAEANYVRPHYCPKPDSADKRLLMPQDFQGNLVVDHKLGKWVIKGTLKLCTFNRATSRTTGLVDADLSLWVTGDTTLEGHYFDKWDDTSPGWKDIELTRSARTAAAAPARRSKGACPTDASPDQSGEDLWTPLMCRECAKAHPGQALPSKCSE